MHLNECVPVVCVCAYMHLCVYVFGKCQTACVNACVYVSEVNTISDILHYIQVSVCMWLFINMCTLTAVSLAVFVIA